MITETKENRLRYHICRQLETLGFAISDRSETICFHKKKREWQFTLQYDYSMGVFRLHFEHSRKWLFLRKTVTYLVLDEMKKQQLDTLLLLEMDPYHICDLFEEVDVLFPVFHTGDKSLALKNLAIQLDIFQNYYDYWYRVPSSVQTYLYTRFSWGNDPKIDVVYSYSNERKKIERALYSGSQYVITEIRTEQDIEKWKEKTKETPLYICEGELCKQIKSPFGTLSFLAELDESTFNDAIQLKIKEMKDFETHLITYIRQKDPDSVVLERGKELTFTFFDSIETISVKGNVQKSSYHVLRSPEEIQYSFYESISDIYAPHHFFDDIFSMEPLLKARLDEIAQKKRMKLLYDTNQVGMIQALAYQMGVQKKNIYHLKTDVPHGEINTILRSFYRQGGSVDLKISAYRFECIGPLRIYKFNANETQAGIYISDNEDSFLEWFNKKRPE